MERLMQYVWQHKLWPVAEMKTVDGRRVRVIDQGLELKEVSTIENGV